MLADSPGLSLRSGETWRNWGPFSRSSARSGRNVPNKWSVMTSVASFGDIWGRVKPTIQRICMYFQLFWCSPGSWDENFCWLVESCWILLNLVKSCWIWLTCGEDRTYYMNLVQPMELPGASLEFRGHQAFVWEALPPRMSDVSTCPTEASFVRPVVDMLEAIKPNEGRPSGLWFNFRGRCFANGDSAYLELGSLVAHAKAYSELREFQPWKQVW